MSSSDSDSELSPASSILDSVVENLNKHLPQSSQAHYMTGSSASTGFFGGRKRHVHDLLGGGHSADILLWRKKHLSAGFLVGATVVWFLFEWIGYHFISVVAFLLLGLVVGLFAWSSGAAFLNRAPPPVPRLQLSDEQVIYWAKTVKIQVNKALAILYEIVIAKDVKQFLKLVGVLSFLVLFGSWFHLLTLLYLVIVAAHTLPLLYENHGNSIDKSVDYIWRESERLLQIFDAKCLSRIPRKQATFKTK
eukprot:c23047_g2_i1 orf=582-1328(-)